jgi:predicted CopG family antitoxin
MTQGTILIKNITRERLKQIGSKGQSYDQLINDLIELKRKSSQDQLKNLKSSQTRRAET